MIILIRGNIISELTRENAEIRERLQITESQVQASDSRSREAQSSAKGSYRKLMCYCMSQF